ncbi:hypothetical protein [Streptosporangium sp. NPDC003464]
MDLTVAGIRVARNADGRLEAFHVGYDSALWHKWQDADGAWSPDWVSLGGNLIGF